MSFTFTEDPQFYCLEVFLSNIFIVVIFSKTEKKFISQQTQKGQYVYDFHTEEGWGCLKTCHVFANFCEKTKMICCSFFFVGEGGGGGQVATELFFFF